MSTAIEFQNVSKYFRMDRDRPRAFQQLFIAGLRGRAQRRADDVFWALRDVSFEVERGDSVGLVGTNGAGKSTTLKLITRIIQPSSGSVRVNGRVTALLELGAGFHPDLSGRDNIYLNGAVMGLSRADITRKLDQIIDFAELEDFIDVPVKDYSSGMFARLGFSVAVHLDPDILLIDEVLSVGDQAFQQKCNERMLHLRKSGVTVLFVSHSLEAVVRTCSKAVWLDRGMLRTSGDVLKVADAYYKHVLEHGSTRDVPANGVNSEGRFGTGEARVVNVELLGADEQPLGVALTHDTVIVRMHYRASTRIETPVFGLAFHDALTGAHLSGPNNSLANATIPFIEGAGHVDYRIERLPFLPGEYNVRTVIYDASITHQYDAWLDCARLRVAPGGSHERHGLVALDGEWSYAAEAPAPARAAQTDAPDAGETQSAKVLPGLPQR